MIWSRMEFFFVSHYLFLSLSKEELLSFSVAALLNSQRKEKEKPDCGPELSFWRFPPTLGRWGPSWGWAGPPEPNKHQLHPAQGGDKHQDLLHGSAQPATSAAWLCMCAPCCCTCSRKQKKRLKKGFWKHKPASLIHIKSLSNLFWNK